MKHIYQRLGMIVLFILIQLSAMAQNARQIQFIDENNSTPIAGVAYKYGDQKGVSNEEGIIELSFIAKESLYLSHLSYGSQVLDEAAVQMALDGGKLSMKQAVTNLQPVNIIALRSIGTQGGQIGIEGKDFLTHDAASILTSMPEIAVIKKSGSYGFDPVLRGFKYEQLNIVIDGAQTAIAACPNRMDPPASQIAPNMMDQIEILKGPHNLRFGSNFGGTLNFMSSKPQYGYDPGLLGRVTAGYESNGGIFRTEGMIGHIGNGHDAKLFGSWSEGSDYTDGDGNTIPSAFKRASFGANLGLKITERQEIMLSATGNFARDVDFAALAMDLRSDDTWLLKANHQISFVNTNLKNWNTTVYGSFVNHVMDNLGKPLDPRMVNAVTDAKTTTLGGRTEGYFEFSKNQLFAGADYKYETATGVRSREFLMGPNAGNTMYDNAWQDGQISKVSAFAEYKQNLENWKFVFSTRLENNSSQLSDAQPEFSGEYASTTSNQFNVSASLGAVRDLGNNFSTGLWIGRAARSGSLTERYINYFPVGLDPYEMLGNPDLKPEINNEVDLSLTYKSAQSLIKIEGFASILNNYISSVIRTDLSPRIPSSPGVRQYINLNNALLTGVEFGWSQNLFAGLSHQLNLAYTFGKDMDTDGALPEIAPFDFRYRLRGSYIKDKLNAEVMFRYVSEQSRIATEFGETVSPSFSLVDLELGYKITPVIGVQAGIHNLFDVAYYEHLSRSVKGANPAPINAVGRNAVLTLIVDFN